MSNTYKFFVKRENGNIKYFCKSYENSLLDWELIDPSSQEFIDYYNALGDNQGG